MTLLLISLCPLLTLPVMPRQDGKVVIVTGGARGIGYEVVRHMVGLGAHVIIGTLSSHAPGQAGSRDPDLHYKERNLASKAPAWPESCSIK